MMANENELFDQQIHDAYERVELSEEARQRMLAHLMVAQLRKQAEDDGNELMDAQGEKEVPETPLEEGLGMASTISSQEPTSAQRYARPRHAAPAKAPSHAAAPMEIPSIVESESSRAEDAGKPDAEPLQKTTVTPRRTGPKHFKSSKAGKAGANGSGSGKSAQGDVITYIPEGRRSHKRSKKWLRLLPLAAAVVLALVVVHVSGVLNSSKDAGANKTAQDYARGVEAEEASASAEGDDQTAEPPADASEVADAAGSGDTSEDASDDAPAVERALTSVDIYPLVTLEDGTSYTALREGLYVEEVESSKIGEQIGAGTAAPFDAPDEAAVGCVVYELQDEDAYAVQYDGEDTYWRCSLT